MKTFIVIFALMIALPGYSKSFPNPSVLFAISEKIINEAQNLVFPTAKEDNKKKKIEIKEKVKSIDAEGEQEFLWNPVQIRRDGMWIVAE